MLSVGSGDGESFIESHGSDDDEVVDDQYFLMQRQFVEKTYGVGAFTCITFKDFADRVLKAKGHLSLLLHVWSSINSPRKSSECG
jgi:hypothetical protein